MKEIERQLNEIMNLAGDERIEKARGYINSLAQQHIKIVTENLVSGFPPDFPDTIKGVFLKSNEFSFMQGVKFGFDEVIQLVLEWKLLQTTTSTKEQ